MVGDDFQISGQVNSRTGRTIYQGPGQEGNIFELGQVEYGVTLDIQGSCLGES